MEHRAKRISALGLLTAVALAIFVIELQIPPVCPIPGIKPGLANIITLWVIYNYSPKEAFSVLAARILLGALFTGNPSALIYSLSGGLLCFSGMVILKRFIDDDHMLFCSIIGAVLHNTGQTAAAVIILGSFSPLAYFPFLLLGGCITGAFTGTAAQTVSRRMKKIGKNEV